MKLTKEQFYKWVRRQSQWTENEMLNPKDKSVADEELVDVITLSTALGIMNRLISGEIVIEEEIQ